MSGVADGVSSWQHTGIDPSLFPSMLMANCMNYLEKKQGKINLVELFSAAYEEILQNNEVDAGTSGSHTILQIVYKHVLQEKHWFLHM